jgi:hypothetical protein
MAALTFSFDSLREGGHFMCKFYQGNEDKALETKLRRLFAKVHREKPDSSRSVRFTHSVIWNYELTDECRNQRKRTSSRSAEKLLPIERLCLESEKRQDGNWLV